MIAVGFDTSNYTTSAAVFSEDMQQNCSHLLPVERGQLGLRQSDALFAHVKQLPQLTKTLFSKVDPRQIAAVGVSTRPRAVEGSYMPCFLAGQSQAEVLADALHVPLYTFSHQQGHIAAALWSAGRAELLEKPHLAWHLSGGTTELLHVENRGGVLCAEKIGGTTDLSAGQLIDRTGQLLGCAFPAGRELDALAAESQSEQYFKVRRNGLSFSLSGVENQVQAFSRAGHSASDTAKFALLSVIQVIRGVTREAAKAYRGLAVVFSGGVASNSILRERFSDMDAVFAAPAFSTDNALGIAWLTWLRRQNDGR